MGIRPRPDDKKAIEVILYVTSNRRSHMYRVLKLLYLADKIHLGRYGRFIYGDYYRAMKSGPVPSRAFDFVKFMRGDGARSMPIPVHAAFEVNGRHIVPVRPADTELLSQSEIECLDEAVRQYGDLTERELYDRSKDQAWWNTPENKPISTVEIARTLPNGEALVDYLLSSER